jgi:hypothetical protein
MAIFKNEQDYLEEWLDYHIKQGIDHFYLYSNDPNMSNYNFLHKYPDLITLIPWVDVKNDNNGTVQRKAYSHCVKNYGHETQFLMMLDIDEFLNPITQKRVVDIIKDINEPNIKAIKIPRYDFGSNGHVKKPNGKVVDNYIKHEKLCSSYKTIANTDYIDINAKFYGVHDFPFLNKDGKVINAYFDYKYTGFPNGCNSNNKNEIPLVINHYYTKSYNEYIKRCQMWKDGGVNNIGYRKDCEKMFAEKDKNESQIF